MRRIVVVLFTLYFGAPAVVTGQDAGPLGPFQWKGRPLLVFASSADEAAYREQIRRVGAADAEFRERDMVLVEIFARGESRAAGQPLTAVDVDALQMDFGVGPDEFRVILVGKDGTEKERWTEPAEMAELFRRVDSMPMRQRELHEGG